MRPRRPPHGLPHPGGTRGLAVVVPAHDEAALLPYALDALRTAAAHPAVRGVPVALVVAADSCRDATADIARAGGAQVVEVAARSAGAARYAGVHHALSLLGTPARATWIATTDADSRVPPDWLAHQLARAEHGWDAVVGTVTVSAWPASYPPGARARYSADYARAVISSRLAHPHVHGANLGVAAHAYQAVGGFPPLATAEDVALVDRLEAGGFRVLRCAACPVDTSARPDGRAPGGFSGHLRELAAREPELP